MNSNLNNLYTYQRTTATFPFALSRAYPDQGADESVHRPQHFLYFLPLPQGHGSFLPGLDFALLSG